MPDAVVIGSGPNGLCAAAYLARAGFSVTVLEAKDTPGGAVGSRELTLPGFIHDIGAAFFPFGETSPALLPLELTAAGLVWKHAPMDSAHPAPDGTCAAIGRDIEASVRAFGEDGEAWRELALWHQITRDRLLLIADPTRAPSGRHTLWAYSRVPSVLSEGPWEVRSEPFADRIEARIEELAPGFRKRILARAIFAPQDLERMNETLVGGDLGGGSAGLRNQLIFRPLFPYFRYRTPFRGLYLASSYAHPGAGVHGACGRNAALAAIADEG